MSVNLMQANSQWATRPLDERFFNLEDMGKAVSEVRTNSREKNFFASNLKAVDNDGELGININGSNRTLKLTHWSGGQLAQYAGAPAEYLRRLPAELAVQNLNYGLSEKCKTGNPIANVMFNRNEDDSVSLRSLNTKQYSRLWNNDVITALKPALDKGWMVPPARPNEVDPRSRPATALDIVPGQDSFGLAVKVGDMIAPGGCFASDRDMFVLLVNPSRMIDLEGDAMMRGIIIENSEVGKSSFRITTFYLEMICGNLIIWRAKNVRQYRKVHKGRNFSNLNGIQNEVRSLTLQSNADTTAELDMVRNAKRYKLGNNKKEVVENLYNNKSLGLTQTVIEASYKLAEVYETEAHAAPNTAWGTFGGLTRYSQSLPNMDERIKLDIIGGKLLQLAQ